MRTMNEITVAIAENKSQQEKASKELDKFYDEEKHKGDEDVESWKAKKY